MPQPSVSVVVATRNRPQRLIRLLEALAAQNLSTEAFEVVTVADGADSQTHALLAGEQARGKLALRVLTHLRPRGPAAARNAGWRAAAAPLIAFTDDDCRPGPGWLAALLANAQEGTFVQGVTTPDPAERAMAGLLSRTLHSNELGPQYETCNIAYPRSALEALGGFDEAFGLAPGGEDTDLAWRAISAGWRPVLAPEAFVRHAVQRLGIIGSLRVAARWSATVRIFAEHPATRTMLYRGRFWNVWHYLMWRSLLSPLAPKWLRRMLLARHLLELRRRAGAGGAGMWGVPFLIVHDAVECWSIARGALRHRTLVL